MELTTDIIVKLDKVSKEYTLYHADDGGRNPITFDDCDSVFTAGSFADINSFVTERCDTIIDSHAADIAEKLQKQGSERVSIEEFHLSRDGLNDILILDTDIGRKMVYLDVIRLGNKTQTLVKIT